MATGDRHRFSSLESAQRPSGLGQLEGRREEGGQGVKRLQSGTTTRTNALVEKAERPRSVRDVPRPTELCPKNKVQLLGWAAI